MSTIQGFLFAFVAMLVMAFLIPALKGRTGTQAPAVQALSGDRTSLSRHLYHLSVGTLISMPALSFILVSMLGLSPLSAYVFVFMGIGVLLSAAIPLMIVKARGKTQYEDYWQFVSVRSGVSRKTILLTWLAVALLTLAMGGAMLVSGRS